ncbi:MAG TPA: bifunctional riboflavin kinase/FAD synthetase [Fimbriimonas sp.]
MQVHFGFEELRPEWESAVGCIGTFDGVHLGHAEVISRAVAKAREAEQPCVLVTFDRHPAAVLAPSRCPKLVAPLQENLKRFEALGVSATVVLPFNAWLSRMSASTFLEDILRKAVRADRLVVGHDFAMGNGREGNTEWLSQRIETVVVPPFQVESHRVSSSAIRAMVEAGDVAHAARLLGRPFTISGVVVRGDKLGAKLGYPTANLARSFDQVVPADGVYSGTFVCAKGTFKTAASIGTRPTVDGQDRRFEAYLLDYPGDTIYGYSADLLLHERLRGQEKFASLEGLIEQMALDVDRVRTLLAAGGDR